MMEHAVSGSLGDEGEGGGRRLSEGGEPNGEVDEGGVVGGGEVLNMGSAGGVRAKMDVVDKVGSRLLLDEVRDDVTPVVEIKSTQLDTGWDGPTGTEVANAFDD
jgi:hypothetical protein